VTKFRKKPVVIEASQYLPDAPVALPEGVCTKFGRKGSTAHPLNAHVHTLEGPLTVSSGDFVIRGVAGEFYPCKPDIFWQTYEPVETKAP
jgi:hypothetical protein